VKAILLVAAVLSLGGCINWQANYDYTARRQCSADPDDKSRRACLDRVEANARDQRAEQRSH
jgi:hypothetical protein